MQPPTWHGKTHGAFIFENSSVTHPTLLRMLPCVQNHGDRTPTIRNGNTTFQLYDRFRRVADFKQQRHSSFRIFLLPFTASKDEPLHIFQIYRFSMLVPSTRTLEQNLLLQKFVVSPCLEYELHVVRGDERLFLAAFSVRLHSLAAGLSLERTMSQLVCRLCRGILLRLSPSRQVT